MGRAVAHAQPTLPRKIDGESGEIQHHPAKDIGNRPWVRKHRMICQVRMGARGVVECGQADAHRREASSDHRLHKEGAGPPMKRSSFASGNRYPDNKQSHRSGSDV